MGCHCKKTLPSKLLIGLSLIIMTLFNDTSYSQLAFKTGGVLQVIGILWFMTIYFFNKKNTCQTNQITKR